MSGFDPAKFDAWLTTPPEDRKPLAREPASIGPRPIGECIHCGGEGCKDCEGDFEPDYDEDFRQRASTFYPEGGWSS